MLSSIRGRIAQALKRHLERRARGQLKKNPALRAILEKARVPGFEHYQADKTTGVDYTDHLFLYNWIKRHKPKEVLEFGPGVSTAVMAQALFENGFGHITSLEDNPQYFEEEKSYLPEYLRSFVTYQLGNKVAKQYGPFVGVGYERIPEGNYDFVVVDGPNYDKNTQYDADLFGVIERNTKPLTAVVDTRTGTCFIYHLVFGKKFRYNYLMRVGFLCDVTKADMRDYPHIVAASMKRKEWRRFFR